MYIDILLATLTYPDATPDRAIRSGVALAKRLGGGLTLLTVKVDIPRINNVLANALVGLDRMAADAEGRSAATAQLEDLCGRIAAEEAGVTLQSKSIIAAPYLEAGVVATAARTHDLCLLPIGPDVIADRDLAEAVLFGSGRPVIVYPEEVEIAPGGGVGKMMIAWDGSTRAARAVADAMPILLQAAEIRVFVAVGEKPHLDAGSAQDLMRHLAAHALPATLRERPAAGRSIGELLTQEVRDWDADLLVMGGFGHARVREFILGGATEAMLQAPPCPVLLSH